MANIRLAYNKYDIVSNKHYALFAEKPQSLISLLSKLTKNENNIYSKLQS